MSRQILSQNQIMTSYIHKSPHKLLPDIILVNLLVRKPHRSFNLYLVHIEINWLKFSRVIFPTPQNHIFGTQFFTFLIRNSHQLQRGYIYLTPNKK